MLANATLKHVCAGLAVFVVAGAANAVQVEGMVGDFKFKELTHHAFNLLNTRVAKFQHVATVNTD